MAKIDGISKLSDVVTENKGKGIGAVFLAVGLVAAILWKTQVDLIDRYGEAAKSPIVAAELKKYEIIGSMRQIQSCLMDPLGKKRDEEKLLPVHSKGTEVDIVPEFAYDPYGATETNQTTAVPSVEERKNTAELANP